MFVESLGVCLVDGLSGLWVCGYCVVFWGWFAVYGFRVLLDFGFTRCCEWIADCVGSGL